MATKIIRFSESEIKKCQSDSAFTEFRDERYPLRLRFNTKRNKASWYIVHCANGKAHWHKIGAWPIIKLKDILANLSQYKANMEARLKIQVFESQFKTVAELLNWYLERSQSDQTIKPSRRTTIKWAITRQLNPQIGQLEIENLNHQLLDEKLFWPLQKEYQIATIRSLWAVLKLAFKRAQKLKLIQRNPVAEFEFSDFIETKIKPKAAQLDKQQLSELQHDIERASVPAKFMVLFMLMHATRIGETRQTKWTHFCFDSQRWHIPEELTKTRQSLTLPLTEQAIDLLKQYRMWQQSQNYSGVFLFPNQRKRNALTANKANDLISEVSKGDWSSHSLRKLARTVWADLGVDYMSAELLLNHALSRLEQTYIHTYAEEQKQKSLTKYHDWLNQQVPELMQSLQSVTDLRSTNQLDLIQTTQGKE